MQGSPRANHWSDLRSHRDALASNVASALDMASSGSIEVPHVNVHLGHDSMTHSEGVELLGASCDLSERAGVRFAHETHRQRLTYSPWRTPMLLRAEPRARLKRRALRLRRLPLRPAPADEPDPPRAGPYPHAARAASHRSASFSRIHTTTPLGF